MAGRLNRGAYQQLVDEDVAWLEKQPRTLERDHVIAIVKESVAAEYGKTLQAPATTSRYALNPQTHQYECSCGAAAADLYFSAHQFLGCAACCPRASLSKLMQQERHAEHVIKIGPATDDELARIRRHGPESDTAVRMLYGLLRARAEADALATVLRERIYPSDNDGEPLERCLNSIGEHGRPTPDRCKQPRTYEFHCDEHRRPHEKEERDDAPLIRALAAYDVSRASAGADTQAYVDRVAELELELQAARQTMRFAADNARISAAGTKDALDFYHRKDSKGRQRIALLEGALEATYVDLAISEHGHEIDGDARATAWLAMTKEQRARCNAAVEERLASEAGGTDAKTSDPTEG